MGAAPVQSRPDLDEGVPSSSRALVHPAMASTTKKLRACLLCSLVQLPSEFRRDGCPNCEQLSMKGDKDRVLECTTSAIDGLIAVVNPQDSWVVSIERDGWSGAYKAVGGCCQECSG